MRTNIDREELIRRIHKYDTARTGYLGCRAYDDDVQSIVQTIAQKYQPEKIIVFGSIARGDWHECSDLDLLVVKKTKKRFFDRLHDVMSIVHESDTRFLVEAFVYTPTEIRAAKRRGNLFIETALEEGCVAYPQKRSRQK